MCQVLSHRGRLKGAVSNSVVTTWSAASSDGLVHFGAYSATCVHQTLKRCHSARLVQLNYHLADFPRVGSDHNQKLLSKLRVFDVPVRLWKDLQIVLKLLKEHIYPKVKLFLNFCLVFGCSDGPPRSRLEVAAFFAVWKHVHQRFYLNLRLEPGISLNILSHLLQVRGSWLSLSAAR